MMGSGTFEGTAMFFFDRWSAPVRDALVAEDPTIDGPATMAAIEAQYRALIPQMSDPGLFAPLLRVFVINGAVYIATYLALAPKGFAPERAWKVCEDATRRFCAAFSKIEDTIVTDTMFSPIMADYLRWEGSRTEREPIGEWVYQYVPGVEGQFNYGVNFERCALRALATKVGTEAFAPYVCLGDIPLSEAFGLGLHRTQTLAQDGKPCDFRFERGAPTVVKKHLPVLAP
ncbi:MAG: L-2-amino-thiazoline-4-carboxylic acid hydrolase [Myxococcales bacterium]|nr:L-2-amino-thiazoline-4-carboxylic acid hydrolase [Myxococcales bacterium]